jgi:trimeric autotransporter adhesin
MKTKHTLVKLTKHAALLLLFATLNLQFATAFAQGTAFTYQGRLNDGANPAGGIYDLRFAIYDSLSAGTQQGSLLTNSATAVSNGLFTATLDFGNQFPDANRWLEIGVRTNGGGSFFTLSPRQALTPAPYAITAGSVVSGGLTAGTYGNAVTFNNANNSFSGAFSGNGANVTNVNATKLGGVPVAGFWQTGGNTGTFPGANILGSLDNEPLELWVNGARALKIIPGTNAVNTPNLISGSGGNTIDPGVMGATIAGGGGPIDGYYYNNYVRANFAAIGGGTGNTASNVCSTVAGGLRNTASGLGSFVGGGGINDDYNNGNFERGNQANGIASVVTGGFANVAGGDYTTVGGGEWDIASGKWATIGGGNLNTNSSAFGTVAGGYQNTASGVTSLVWGPGSMATVGGGERNTAAGNVSTIAGGDLNTAAGSYATIGGGEDNNVTYDYGTVAGGTGNSAAGAGAIAGGEGNAAGGDAAVGGGKHNNASGGFSMIPGGFYCVATGKASFAAGTQAQANHQGSFVWADYYLTNFSDTANNQFLIRAAGGVGIDTSAPETALHIADVGGITLGTSAKAGGYTALRIDLSEAQSGYAELQAISSAGSSYGPLILQANGGNVGIGITNPASKLTVNGNILATGTIIGSSDRNVKEHFSPVSARDVLEKVSTLPISEWNYKADNETLRHIGPMAQDFYAAFNVGMDDKHISMVDADGVALAAIQGLNQKLNEKETEIADLQKRLEALEKSIRSQKSN